MSTDLKQVFKAFCSFGKGHNAPASETDQMDNKCFAKFCKDTGITKGNVTDADIDIVFTKARYYLIQVKSKGARKLDYQQFMLALKELAAKKFPEKKGNAGFEALVASVKASGATPSLDKTTTLSNDEITARMTDTTKYTGIYKLIFRNSQGEI